MRFRIREEYCSVYKQNLFYPEYCRESFFSFFFTLWLPVYRFDRNSERVFAYCLSKERAEHKIERFKNDYASRLVEQSKKESSRKIHYL